MTEPLGYSIEGGAEYLGVGRSLFCELIRRGEIESVKVGRRRIIPAESLRAYMARLIEAARAQPPQYETTYTEHGHNTHQVPLGHLRTRTELAAAQAGRGVSGERA
jgi:excisionase family DNA binding protein